MQWSSYWGWRGPVTPGRLGDRRPDCLAGGRCGNAPRSYQVGVREGSDGGAVPLAEMRGRRDPVQSRCGATTSARHPRACYRQGCRPLAGAWAVIPRLPPSSPAPATSSRISRPAPEKSRARQNRDPASAGPGSDPDLTRASPSRRHQARVTRVPGSASEVPSASRVKPRLVETAKPAVAPTEGRVLWPVR